MLFTILWLIVWLLTGSPEFDLGADWSIALVACLLIDFGEVVQSRLLKSDD